MYENMNMYISKAYLFAYANILYYSFFFITFLDGNTFQQTRICKYTVIYGYRFLEELENFLGGKLSNQLSK